MEITRGWLIDDLVEGVGVDGEWVGTERRHLAEKPWGEAWQRASSRMFSPAGRRCLSEADADAAAERGSEDVVDLCKGDRRNSSVKEILKPDFQTSPNSPMRIVTGTILGGMLGFYLMHRAELKYKEMWNERLRKYEEEMNKRKMQEAESNEFQESL
ncbi:hypothetical protein STAS_30131 [Striga asiatica]|uniref:Uncharacterized protein n=1 Tax=Striga asiatica TaxID=4170 RepID=A0A5A7R5I4_STRAF|nr:hypothetical protein STAS_30131 [Striga asiatica]